MSISTFEDYQALEASEKEGLLIIEAAKRLVGWVVHSGSVYKLTSFDHPVLSPDSPVQDSGTALSSAGSTSLSAGQYYHDLSNKILYLRTSDSVNPNTKFITLCFRLFFSRSGRNLSHDLSTGFDVHWLPYLKGTSDFGVELDNQNQLGSAIEGTGRVELFNDQAFWSPIYDKYYFENQRAYVYSWNPLIPITEAKLIYRGRVQKKSYTPLQITFELQDVLNELRAPVALEFLGDYAGVRIPDSLNLAFQRRVYGYVNGHRPTNIDHVLSGYALSGTVTATGASTTVTGSGTSFLSQVLPGDALTIFDVVEPIVCTVASVASDTSLTLTEGYSGNTAAGLAVTLKAALPGRTRNRVFLVAGHPLCEPSTTVVSAITTSMINVASVNGLRAGDALTVAGEATTIVRISGNKLKLSTSLVGEPDPGDTVLRPAITNVYLNDRELTLNTDYTYDASDATITLNALAEVNIARPKKLQGTLTFTSSSRTVTGSGTSFTTELKPGDWVKALGQSAYFEVLSVTDDTSAVLRTAASYSVSVSGLVKRPDYYVEGQSILSCDVLGRTHDNTTSGTLLQTAPQIVEDLLKSAGLTSLLNTASFTLAKQLTNKRLGLVIPKKFGDKKADKLRDVINEINKSDFGSLVQNEDFELEYQTLSPDKPSTLTRFSESDALAFAIESDSNNIVKTSRVNYAFREVDPVSRESLNLQEEKTSQTAQYLAQATKEFLINTLLIDQNDARIYANRWAFLFEVASSVVKLGTKLQGSRLQVGDKVELSHEKMYERVGSTDKRKIAAVSRAKRSLSDSSIELDDLSNAFSRCAVITDNDAVEYVDATEIEHGMNGYICDVGGMQGNDPETFGINLIW